ncbi:interferon-induced transmembrane protein 5-like [Tympanuchus pallidicinctus]|uniref:interferon-induced transmembrane protein 5-like n=1 Tax=Tympanuchus pallidicinctus TaxID=109042 RepID=UPI002286FCE4|nr:interferon-induced transmembrane protein 5-like [Tympanuchus pallidicinctus]
MKPQQPEVSIPLHPPGRGPPLSSVPQEQPRDFVLWSLFNVLAGFALAYLGCFCFPSLIFSIKARDCKVLGDLEGARRYGTRAKVLNIIFSVLIAIGVLSTITIAIVLLTKSSRQI